MSNCTLKYGSIFVALGGRGCSRLEKIESFFPKYALFQEQTFYYLRIPTY